MIITTLYQSVDNADSFFHVAYNDDDGTWVFTGIVRGFVQAIPLVIVKKTTVDKWLAGHEQIHHDNGNPVSRGTLPEHIPLTQLESVLKLYPTKILERTLRNDLEQMATTYKVSEKSCAKALNYAIIDAKYADYLLDRTICGDRDVLTRSQFDDLTIVETKMLEVIRGDLSMRVSAEIDAVNKNDTPYSRLLKDLPTSENTAKVWKHK